MFKFSRRPAAAPQAFRYSHTTEDGLATFTNSADGVCRGLHFSNNRPITRSTPALDTAKLAQARADVDAVAKMMGWV